MTDSLFARVREQIRELLATDDDRPDLDREHLEQLDYEHLATTTEVDGAEVIRCNLCARVFDVDDMTTAVDHVASHDDQVGEEIDPFSSEQSEAVYGYIEEEIPDSDPPQT